MGRKIVAILTSKWFLTTFGLLVGAGVILAIRFVTYAPETVHYHANFAVYINGQQEQFKDMKYYEETAATSCSIHPIASPLDRAHMHDNVSSVVHVEDHLVTWGNFFQNLNWGIGDNYLKTADQFYIASDQSQLTFMLNGKRVDSIANTIISDQDKLLVSYGSDTSQVIQKQYDKIQNNAAKNDAKQDPASCSGNHVKVDTKARLSHLF